MVSAKLLNSRSAAESFGDVGFLKITRHAPDIHLTFSPETRDSLSLGGLLTILKKLNKGIRLPGDHLCSRLVPGTKVTVPNFLLQVYNRLNINFDT